MNLRHSRAPTSRRFPRTRSSTSTSGADEASSGQLVGDAVTLIFGDIPAHWPRRPRSHRTSPSAYATLSSICPWPINSTWACQSRIAIGGASQSPTRSASQPLARQRWRTAFSWNGWLSLPDRRLAARRTVRRPSHLLAATATEAVNSSYGGDVVANPAVAGRFFRAPLRRSWDSAKRSRRGCGRIRGGVRRRRLRGHRNLHCDRMA